MGAIFLDSDYTTVSGIILKLYDELLNESGPEDSLKDFKTQLQELLQKKVYELPQYELIETKGKDHNAVFTVNCFLADQKIQIDQDAKSIKRAEQSCAKLLLEKLKENK